MTKSPREQSYRAKFIALKSISPAANALIEKFENTVTENLKSDKFARLYDSFEDILERKYHLKNLDEMDFPDFKNKTEFIVKGVRGNISKAEGKLLTYKEANEIIETGLNIVLP